MQVQNRNINMQTFENMSTDTSTLNTKVNSEIIKFSNIDSSTWTIKNPEVFHVYNTKLPNGLRIKIPSMHCDGYPWKPQILGAFYTVLTSHKNSEYDFKASFDISNFLNETKKEYDLLQFIFLLNCYPERLAIPLRDRMLLYIKFNKLVLRITNVNSILHYVLQNFPDTIRSSAIFFQNPLLIEILPKIRMQNLYKKNITTTEKQQQMTLSYVYESIKKLNRQTIQQMLSLVSDFMHKIIELSISAEMLSKYLARFFIPLNMLHEHSVMYNLYVLLTDSKASLPFMPQDARIGQELFLKQLISYINDLNTLAFFYVCCQLMLEKLNRIGIKVPNCEKILSYRIDTVVIFNKQLKEKLAKLPVSIVTDNKRLSKTQFTIIITAYNHMIANMLENISIVSCKDDKLPPLIMFYEVFTIFNKHQEEILQKEID